MRNRRSCVYYAIIGSRGDTLRPRSVEGVWRVVKEKYDNYRIRDYIHQGPLPKGVVYEAGAGVIGNMQRRVFIDRFNEAMVVTGSMHLVRHCFGTVEIKRIFQPRD